LHPGQHSNKFVVDGLSPKSLDREKPADQSLVSIVVLCDVRKMNIE
jgi:hypothetical protein